MWNVERRVANRLPKRTGFTLIELLIVIAIIAILAALLMPTLQKAKFQARQARCLSNHHQVLLALFLYADDFNGYYPARYPILNGLYANIGPNYMSNYTTGPSSPTWWSYHETFVKAYLGGPDPLRCAINTTKLYPQTWPGTSVGNTFYWADMDVFAGWYAPYGPIAGTLPAGVTAKDFPLRVGDAPDSPLTSCSVRDQWDNPAATAGYHHPGFMLPRPGI